MNRITRNRSSRGNARRSGTAVLEMAISLAILFYICFGLVEFGYFFFVKNTVESSAREGCRAAIAPSADQRKHNQRRAAKLQAAGLVATTATTTTPYTVTTSPTDITTANLGTTVSCTVTATWSTVGASYSPLGLIARIAPARTVNGVCSMRKEG